MRQNKVTSSEEHRLNLKIRENEVRLVEMPEGYENGVYSISSALQFAEELNCDLIEISNKVKPVVCKIMEYSKFKYDKKKKEKDLKKKSSVSILKELKFTPDIADNDLNIKSKKAIEFLTEGNKVRVTVQFKGRGIVFKDRGTLVLLKMAKIVEEYGLPETMPELTGKRMSFVLKPKK